MIAIMEVYAIINDDKNPIDLILKSKIPVTFGDPYTPPKLFVKTN